MALCGGMMTGRRSEGVIEGFLSKNCWSKNCWNEPDREGGLALSHSLTKSSTPSDSH